MDTRTPGPPHVASYETHTPMPRLVFGTLLGITLFMTGLLAAHHLMPPQREVASSSPPTAGQQESQRDLGGEIREAVKRARR